MNNIQDIHAHTDLDFPTSLPVRFNRRFYPYNAFRSLLGIGSEVAAPTYDELYQHKWQHPAIGGVHG